MAESKSTGLVRANTSGHADVKGTEYAFHQGELYRANHPLVKACPLFFDPAEDSARPVIEAATAGPGEVRGEEE